MKLIACSSSVPREQIASMLHLPGTSSSFSFSNDLESAMSVASKAVNGIVPDALSVDCQRSTIFVGRQSVQSLFVASVPCRALVQRLLQLSRSRKAIHLDEQTVIGIYVFDGDHLTDVGCKPITIKLAKACGLVPSQSNMFDSIPLHFGNRFVDHQKGLVELHSVVEYDGLIDCAFKSETFCRTLLSSSLLITVQERRQGKRKTVAQHTEYGYIAHGERIDQSPPSHKYGNSFWFLHERHCEEYCAVFRRCAADARITDFAFDIGSVVVVGQERRDIEVSANLWTSLWTACNAVAGKSAVSSPAPDVVTPSDERISLVEAMRDEIAMQGADHDLLEEKFREVISHQQVEQSLTANLNLNIDTLRREMERDSLFRNQISVDVAQNDKLLSRLAFDLETKRNELRSYAQHAETERGLSNSETIVDETNRFLQEASIKSEQEVTERKAHHQNVEGRQETHLSNALVERKKQLAEEFSKLQDIENSSAQLETVLAGMNINREESQRLLSEKKSQILRLEQRIGLLDAQGIVAGLDGAAGLEYLVDTSAQKKSSLTASVSLLEESLLHESKQNESIEASYRMTQREHGKRKIEVLENCEESRKQVGEIVRLLQQDLLSEEVASRMMIVNEYQTEFSTLTMSCLFDARRKWHHEGELQVLTFTDSLKEKEYVLHSTIAARKTERNAAHARCTALVSHIAASAVEHQSLTDEMQSHLKKVREQKFLVSEQQFPSLPQEALFGDVVRSLRNALSLPAAVLVTARESFAVHPNFESHLTQPLRKAPRVKVTGEKISDQLEQLIRWTAAYEVTVRAGLVVAHESLTKEELDLQEKKVILDETIQQSKSFAASLEKIRNETVAATWSLSGQRSRHDIVRLQLQREYEDACSTLIAHRDEGESHLHYLESQETALNNELDRIRHDVQQLENSHLTNSLTNPKISVDLFREMCVAEKQRNSALRSSVAQEDTLMKRATISSPLPGS